MFSSLNNNHVQEIFKSKFCVTAPSFCLKSSIQLATWNSILVDCRIDANQLHTTQSVGVKNNQGFPKDDLHLMHTTEHWQASSKAQKEGALAKQDLWSYIQIET